MPTISTPTGRRSQLFSPVPESKGSAMRKPMPTTGPTIKRNVSMFGGSSEESMDDDLIYGERDVDRGSQVVRSYKTDRPLHEQMRERTTDASDRDPAYGERAKSGSSGATLAGLGNEGMGNVKQGIGSLTGNDELKRSGLAQERQGETQQGKTPGYDN